uniref:U5 small nuclear riboponucleoprotein 200 kDa subunit n=1 Tax=Lotharella vacuolata TaxID=74820 RepID=A0A0H5BGW6_9EUKA|nr:U5 small nuclear riboponucleoprotein 200 kDa subunit [Lotharella vacuolata]
MNKKDIKGQAIYTKINDLLIFDFIRKKIGINSSEFIENIYKKILFIYIEKKIRDKKLLFSKFKKIFQCFSKSDFDFLLQLMDNNRIFEYKNLDKKQNLIEKISDINHSSKYLFLDKHTTLEKKNKYINIKNSFKNQSKTIVDLKKENIINGILMIEKLDSKSIIYQIIQKIYKILLEYDDMKLESKLVAILGFENIKLIRFITRNKNIFINCLFIKKKLQNIDKSKIKQCIIKKANFLRFLKKSDLIVFSKVLKNQFNYADHNKNFFIKSQHKQKKKFKLPLNTYKILTPLFDEINISFIINPVKKMKELINLDNVSSLFRKVLSPVKNFNYIQSKVYPVIMNTNTNILLCAPTGSGKTLVAFLCTLKTLLLLKNATAEKIVIYSPNVFYLAPMKALIKEITKKMKKIFDYFNIKIVDVTTDVKITKNEFRDKFVVVTTPEKLDIISRKPYNVNVVKFIKLIIFDEIHLLNSERGVSIENLIARMYFFCDIYKKKVRLVALSATFPNFTDLSKLLCINNHIGLFYFDENFRSCSISYHILGVKNNKFMNSNEIMYQILKENLMLYVNNNNQIIIFVNSRKDTFLTGNLVEEIIRVIKNYNTIRLNDETNEIVDETTNLFKIESIKKLLKKKIGIHNAGLDKRLREMMEDMFKEKIIKILVSTATLAWGVNLPSKIVIIKGTKIYNPKINGWVEINLLDLIQMFGRAGRPQFDKNGIGVLITSIENIKYYTSLFNNNIKIESFFHKYVISSLNAEVANGVITNLPMSINWLFLTYYCIRLKEKIYSWILSDVYKIIQKEYLKLIKKLIYKSLGKLENISFISYDGQNLRSTEIGRISSFNIVNYITLEYLNKNCKFISNDVNFLKLLAKSAEFKNIIIRVEELIELNNLFEVIPIPVSYNINLSYIKVIILIEHYISNAWAAGTVLQCDSSFIIKNVVRIIRAISQISLKRLNLTCFKLSLKFFKMIDNQLWNVLVPYRQIRLIPEYFFTKIMSNKTIFNKLFFKAISKEDVDVIANKHLESIKAMIMYFPLLKIKSSCNPVASSLVVIHLYITPNFEWNKFVHSRNEFFWLIISDSNNSKIIYYDLFSINHNNIKNLIFFNVLLSIKIAKTAILFVEIVSDKWLRSECVVTISIENLIFPRGSDFKLEYKSSLHYVNKYEKIFYFNKKRKLYKKIDNIFLKKISYIKNDIYIILPLGYNKKNILNLILASYIQNMFINKNKYKIAYICSHKKKSEISLDSYKNEFFYSCIHKPKEGVIIDFLAEQEIILNFSNFSVTDLFDFNPLLDFDKFKKICNENLLLIIDEFLFEDIEERAEIEFLITKTKILNLKKNYDIKNIYFSFFYINCDDLVSWLSIEKKFIIFLGNKNSNQIMLKYFEKYLTHFNNKEVVYQSYFLINVTNKVEDLFIIILPTILDVYAFLENLNLYFGYFRNKNVCKYFLYKIGINNFLKILYNRGIGLFLKIKKFALKEFSISMIISSYISTLVSVTTYSDMLPIKFGKILFVYDDKKKHREFSNNNKNKTISFLNKFFSEKNIKNKIYIFLSNNYKKVIRNYENFFFFNSLLHNNVDKYFCNLFLIIKDKKKDVFRSFLTWTFLEKSIRKNPNYYKLENANIKKVNLYYSELIERFFLNFNKLKITNESGKINEINLNMFLLVNKYNIHQKIVFQIRKKLFMVKNYKNVIKTLSFLYNNDVNNKDICDVTNIFSNFILLDKKYIERNNSINFFSVNLDAILVKFMQREIIMEEIKFFFSTIVKKCYLYLNFLLDLSILKGDGNITFLFLEFIQVFRNALPNKKLSSFQIPFFNIIRDRISHKLKLNKIDDIHFININRIKKRLKIFTFELEFFSCYVESRYSTSIYYIHKKKIDLFNLSVLKNYFFSIITENLNLDKIKYSGSFFYPLTEKNTWIIVTSTDKKILILSKKLNLEYNNKFKFLILKKIFYFSVIITNIYHLGYEITII